MQEFKVGDRVCEAGTDNTGIIHGYSDSFAWVWFYGKTAPETVELEQIRKVGSL